MNWLPELERFFYSLLNRSLQGGVLVMIILLLQWIFRRQLTSRWRFALWSIVLLQLLLPFRPESTFSVFNLFQPEIHSPTQSGGKAQLSRVTTSIDPALRGSEPGLIQQSHSPVLPDSSLDQAVPSQTIFEPRKTFLSFSSVVALWLCGVVLLAGCVTFQLFRFQRKLLHSHHPANPALTNLLWECQKQFNPAAPIELLVTDAVTSPALFGLRKPRLLLPRGIEDRFSLQELRFIFLHELAHVKRRDLWLNWLLTALQIVHWFNPLIWFGFARLRSDRELACDEVTLSYAGEEMGMSYGETIIKLLEGVRPPAAIPGLVGILEDKKQMHRRIASIANFRKPGRLSALGILLLAGLTIVGLTNPKSRAQAGSAMSGSANSHPVFQTVAHPAPSNTMWTASSASPIQIENVKYNPIDLKSYYQRSTKNILTSAAGNNSASSTLSAIPWGNQILDGVPFNLGGIIEVTGLGPARDQRFLPSQTGLIHIGSKAETLHLVHGTSYSAPDGTPIAEVVLHYADNSRISIPLRYGVHVRNWWDQNRESKTVSDPASSIWWKGNHPVTEGMGFSLRLFHSRLQNPFPDKVIDSIEFVTLFARPAPAFYALTLGSGDSTSASTSNPLSPTEEAQMRSVARIKIMDAASGQGISGALVSLEVVQLPPSLPVPTASDAATSYPFGQYQSDEKGQITLYMPVQKITQVNVTVTAAGYAGLNDQFGAAEFNGGLTLKLKPAETEATNPTNSPSGRAP
jgi:beta-lactamase regulating signal transducer with metallopeptidase domain